MRLWFGATLSIHFILSVTSRKECPISGDPSSCFFVCDSCIKEKGSLGDQGLPGYDGAPGMRGLSGVPGIPGRQGESGRPGRCGRKGKLGVLGPRGLVGFDGRNGVPGMPGTRWFLIPRRTTRAMGLLERACATKWG